MSQLAVVFWGGNGQHVNASKLENYSFIHLKYSTFLTFCTTRYCCLFWNNFHVFLVVLGQKSTLYALDYPKQRMFTPFDL